VVEGLDAALDEARRQQQDPAPLRGEAEQRRAEIARLVDGLARGARQDTRRLCAVAERGWSTEAPIAGIGAARGQGF
jgi:hypothetical protein